MLKPVWTSWSLSIRVSLTPDVVVQPTSSHQDRAGSEVSPCLLLKSALPAPVLWVLEECLGLAGAGYCNQSDGQSGHSTCKTSQRGQETPAHTAGRVAEEGPPA